MTCQDCLLALREVRILWTAPNGDRVCADCLEMRTGQRPKGLRELEAERAAKARRGRTAKRVTGTAVVMLALLGAVACSSPTAPDYTGVPLVFEGVPVSADQQAAAIAEFDFQAACTGWRGKLTAPLPVTVHPGFFACVSVAANGCTRLSSGYGQGRIEVSALTFVPAVSHELIHWMRDLPDPEHTDPVWDRCDHLHDRGKK